MLKCECVSYDTKSMLEDAIAAKRFELGNEYRELRNSKLQENAALNIKQRLNEYDELYQDIRVLPVCTLEERRPIVKKI